VHDSIDLTEDRPLVEITGRGLCPACGSGAVWCATVTREALGTAFYSSACSSCGEETTHSIDLLAGMARSWES
jgi:hypothetical protein